MTDGGLRTSQSASDPGSAAVWGSKRKNPWPQSCLCLAWSACSVKRRCLEVQFFYSFIIIFNNFFKNIIALQINKLNKLEMKIEIILLDFIQN